MPPQKTISMKIIPPGATCKIQPLDVGFFRHHKSLVEKIHSHVITLELNFALAQRDSLLELQSVVYFILTRPIFRNVWIYARHETGYLDTRPLSFNTPSVMCFDKDRKMLQPYLHRALTVVLSRLLK